MQLIQPVDAAYFFTSYFVISSILAVIVCFILSFRGK